MKDMGAGNGGEEERRERGLVTLKERGRREGRGKGGGRGEVGNKGEAQNLGETHIFMDERKWRASDVG